jgi:hypothetical protein
LHLLRNALVASVLTFSTCSAHAHGIAGNRYFDGTMTFDDPAVADEAIVPLYTDQQYPTQGSTVSENRINAAFARLLTPTLAFTVDSGWIHQNWPVGHTSGFDKTDVGLKYDRRLRLGDFPRNRNPALGFFDPVQHPLSDEPIRRGTAERVALEPMGVAGRVQI